MIEPRLPPRNLLPPAAQATAATTQPIPAGILPGDLLFCRSEGLVGWLIRFGERRKYKGWWGALKITFAETILRKTSTEDDEAWGNHIAVYVGDGFVIEALARGLTLTPVSNYMTPNLDGTKKFEILPLSTIRPNTTDADRAALVNFAYAELAAKYAYGWLSILSIVFSLCTPEQMALQWDGAMICSAFGARCWEHAGVNTGVRNIYDAMPTDLWELTQAPTIPPSSPTPTSA